MKMTSIFVAAICLMSCSSIPNYHPATSKDSTGFSDQRIANNEYRVTFQGSRTTSRQYVEDFLLIRAAEITHEKGFDFFQILERHNETHTKIVVSKHPHRYLRFDHPYHHDHYTYPYYTQGYDWNITLSETSNEYKTYSATAFIKLLSVEQSEDRGEVFNAKSVIEDLGPVQCWKKQPHEENKCLLEHSED